MKKAVSFLIFSLVFYYSKAQSGEWTWVHGSNNVNAAGNYGTQGVPALSNEPAAVYGPAKWTDLDGNFWIFGGTGYIPFLNNTLWKFDPVSNMWTWMKGSSAGNDPGSYGTMGIPSPSNNPGARAYGAATWVDSNGDLWMFGGNGVSPTWSGMLADVWKYTIATNEWTWMQGNPGDYSNFGTMQVPNATNSPGQREECTANWIDVNGNLWFYGGLRDGFGATDGNDMWMFDIGTNIWTWMAGSISTNLFPVYGTQNVFDPANNPGGRMNYAGWQDADGIFWLFGGTNEAFSYYYSDLWKFDPAIYQWAWASGSNVINNAGFAGGLCDTSAGYYPMSRFENRATWLDSCGNFWLFGGYQNGDLNDLWMYQPTADIWSFVGGSLFLNQQGSYGTLGVPSPTNVCGGRMGAVSFYGNDGNLWLFGGTKSYVGYFFNDLWKFNPDPLCPEFVTCNPQQPANVISASDTDVCEKFCVDFFDLSINNPTSWQWLFPGGTPGSSTAQNPTNICYTSPGIFDVTLITTNATGSDTVVLIDYITVYDTPPFPTITQSGNTLTSSPATSYQWQFNSIDIAGATNQAFTATQTGYYTVVITDSNGCKKLATVFVTITGMEELLASMHLSIYPNPSIGIFTVEWTSEEPYEELRVEVTNTLGQLIFSDEEKNNVTHFERVIDLHSYPHGIYFLELSINRSGDGSMVSSGKKKLIYINR